VLKGMGVGGCGAERRSEREIRFGLLMRVWEGSLQTHNSDKTFLFCG